MFCKYALMIWFEKLPFFCAINCHNTTNSIFLKMAKDYLIDIIIVNWNGGQKILECIQPLMQNAVSNMKLNIIVSDNGSTDGSVEAIAAAGITVIENKSNLGFGAACNRVLPYCTGDYILLLNPDAVVTCGSIALLAEKLAKEPDMGAIGPRQVDENGNTQYTCGRFPTFITSIWELTGLSKMLPGLFTPAPIMLDWAHDTSRKVDHVMGSCMLLKRQLTDKFGFMDEGYFVYLEDLDLSKRLHDAGYYSYYDHTVSVYHEGGGLSKKAKPERLFYSLDSKLYYWKKHFKKPAYFILFVISFTIEPFIRTLFALAILNIEQAKATLKAYRLLINKYAKQ